MRNSQRLDRKISKEEEYIGRCRRGREDNIKIDGWGDVDWIHLALEGTSAQLL
jgi:hypothetical protein